MESKFHNNSTIKHNPNINRRNIFPPYVWKRKCSLEKRLVVRIQSCKEMQSKRRKNSSLSSYHTKGGGNGHQQLKNIYHKGANFFLTPCFALLCSNSATVAVHSFPQRSMSPKFQANYRS